MMTTNITVNEVDERSNPWYRRGGSSGSSSDEVEKVAAVAATRWKPVVAAMMRWKQWRQQ